MKKVEVLLVEDSPADAKLVEIHLVRVKEVKYNVRAARNLAEAVDALNEPDYHPDVCLLDLSLPGSSGLETYRVVRLSRPVLPVLILTGLFDRELATQAVAEGAGGYVLKSSMTPSLLELNIALAIEVSKRLLLERYREEIAPRLSAAQRAELAGLAAILSACAVCGRVKDVSQPEPARQWVKLADYLAAHGVELSHTYCPDCMPGMVRQAVAGKD